MPKIKIAVAGCLGRMGKEIINKILSNNKLSFVGGFEHKSHPMINKKISDVSNFGSANFDLSTARELTNLSRRMKVISRREMKKVDPKAALSYRTLQRNYSETTNALYPEINTRFITQAGKGGFSSLGKMFSMAGASDNIGMAFRSIDTAYKQMSPKDIAKLPYKSAADAKKAVRTSYVQSVLPNAEKATFDLKDFAAVAKSLNDPTEAARVRILSLIHI